MLQQLLGLSGCSNISVEQNMPKLTCVQLSGTLSEQSAKLHCSSLQTMKQNKS